MVDLTNKDEFESWLKNQSRDVCLAVSARAALRAFPVFMDHFKHLANGKIETRPLVLSVIQALALAYAAAKYPTKFPIPTTKSDQFAASTFVQNLNASDYAAEATYSAYNYVSTADIGSAVYAVFNSSAAVANGAAVTAGAGLDAANIASSAMHVAAARDAEFINNGYSSDALVNEPLWLKERFEWVIRIWRQLETPLLDMNENWDVWIRWYDAILDGRPTPGGEELDIFRVKLNSKEDWSKGPAFVNLLIKTMEDGIAAASFTPIASQVFEDFVSEEIEATDFSQATVSENVPEDHILNAKTTGEELAKYSSPQPVLTPDGKLDVRPNSEFDVVVASIDLPTLPIRQLRLIDVILGDLPQQAPRHLKSSLEHYGGELKARGVNPILGILTDMAEIIAAASSENDGEWLQAGLRKSFELFNANHGVFIEHFPLDIERERRFSEIEVNEEIAIGEAFVKPFRDAEAAVKASDFVTADTVIVVERMRELAEITAYMPPAHGGYLNPKNVFPQSSDRLIHPTTRVSVKKRLILQAMGYWSACMVVLSPTGKAIDLLYKFSKIIELVQKYILHSS